MTYAETDDLTFRQKECRRERRARSSPSCDSARAESQSSGTGKRQGHTADSTPFNLRSKRKVETLRDFTVR
jgi:hypothetical protein